MQFINKYTKTYTMIQKNTVAQYIATWSFMYLCEVAEMNQGSQVGMRCREHAGMDLVGTR